KDIRSETGETEKQAPPPLNSHDGYTPSLSPQSSSVSLHRSVSDDEEVGGAQRMEVTFVMSDVEEEAGPSNDITALLLRYRHGNWRAGIRGCQAVINLQGPTVSSIIFQTHPLLIRDMFVCLQVSEELPVAGGLSWTGRRLHLSVSLQGGVVYANYGRPEDFNWLKSAGISVTGCVVVMRVGGGVSFAEKVWLAERNGAGGVLIYPDPADLPQDPRRLGLNTHTTVHLGSGDPFTPGFPSFNHTQFPPIQSSGLPLIPALPISATVAAKLLSQLSGPSCPPSWRGRLPYVRCVSILYLCYNGLLLYLFVSLSDQYIILGAQRDSLSPGAVKSGVGTAILLELARTFSAMVKNGFSPRRSLLFVSWDAGEFGNVGATEWLEGYLSMLHLKAVAYFSLDQAVMGNRALIQSGDVFNLPANQGLREICVCLCVCVQERAYLFVNTPLDSASRLQEVLGGRLGVTGRSLGELVGEMVLRLAHDHILPHHFLCPDSAAVQCSAQRTLLSLSPQWVFSARGDYSRAAETLQRAIDYSDLHDPTTARFYNLRIMKVEYYFLSQYVSVVETPFRHVIHGRGDHTLSALTEHLALLTSDPERFDETRFRRQLALFTWTLQGAANALNGDVWSIHNTHTYTR
uniref:Uncharacterized protein n=1 Tax=Monopterus albus TaxID=43700 RepID=A0A3Q3ITN8_MONAL